MSLFLRRTKVFVISSWTFVIFSDGQAFVQSKSEGGENLYWPNGHQDSLTLYVNPANGNDLLDESVEKVIDFSIRQWNNNGDIFLYRMPSSTNAEERNDLYFSTDPIFGAGVLAVTRVSYLDLTGQIIEADVIINDHAAYSDEVSSNEKKYFLGDVVAHELGHFFGLSHGQVHESTMTFTVFKGQYSLHSDDREALNSIYTIPTDDSHYTAKGTLRGTVAGFNLKNGVIGVFGAHVQAIASSTGEVVASVVTGPKGQFSISSLPVGETYYLYVSPIHIASGLPKYYDTFESGFCLNKAPWQGAYFRKCGNGEKGYPQGLYLGTAEEVINVGTITIHCEFETPMGHSPGGDYRLNIIQPDGNVGEAVTGFFSETHIDTNSSSAILNDPNKRVSDTYTIDLTSYSPDKSKDLYLDIKIVAQKVYSPLRMNIFVERTGYSGHFPSDDFNVVKRVQELDHKSVIQDTTYNLDHVIHVPLDEDYPSYNSFVVELIPQPLTQGLTGVSKNNFFPSRSILSNSLGHYMMILTISEKTANGYHVIEEKEYLPYSDNLACMDGPNTFMVQGKITSSSKMMRKDEEGKAAFTKLLCGAVDFNGPNSGGGSSGNFILILVVTVLMAMAERKRRKKQKFQIA